MDFARRPTLLLAASLTVLPGSLLSKTAHAASNDAELDALRAELSETKKKLTATEETLGRVVARLDQLEARAAAAPPPRLRRAARASRPSTPTTRPSASWSTRTLRSDTEDPGWNFSLRAESCSSRRRSTRSCAATPRINGTSDEGFDIEEAALVTTALPWNLTVKGGRFIADVGRLPHWHDEALPFTESARPRSTGMIGGESQAEGVEVTWLAPIDHYLSVTTGLYNTIGADRNDRAPRRGLRRPALVQRADLAGPPGDLLRPHRHAEPRGRRHLARRPAEQPAQPATAST